MTCTPDALETIAVTAKELVSRAKLAGGAADMQKLLADRLELYTNEIKEIKAARSIGPTGVRAGVTFLDVRARHHGYIREFAGKSRGSRDVAMLIEAAIELESLQSSLEAAAKETNHEMIREFAGEAKRVREMFNKEIEEITKARDGLLGDDAHSSAAEAANTLFTRYRQQFAGLSRLSRRPALMERMLNSLKDVRAWMDRTIVAGEVATQLANNKEIVDGHLGRWESELSQIRTARASCDFNDLVVSFDEEFRLVTELYQKDFAGQDRRTRDVESLSGAISRLDELERMFKHQLGLQQTIELQQRIGAVRELRMKLMREYDTIVRAKADANGNAAVN